MKHSVFFFTTKSPSPTGRKNTLVKLKIINKTFDLNEALPCVCVGGGPVTKWGKKMRHTIQEATDFFWVCFSKYIITKWRSSLFIVQLPNPLSWEDPFKTIKPLGKRQRIYRGIFAVPVEPAADEDGPLDRHGGDEHVQGHSWQPVPQHNQSIDFAPFGIPSQIFSEWFTEPEFLNV